MTTTSIFSQNSGVENGIYIKGDFKRSFLKSDTNNLIAGKSPFKKEKAIVKSIFQTFATDKNIAGNYKYTLQQGDHKRLNKDGVLRVYNLKEPIDIPVRRLLGNWKRTHTGVTLIVANGQWCTGGNPVDIKPEPIVMAALKSIWKFALA